MSARPHHRHPTDAGERQATTARLASAAGAGELLITDADAREAAIDTTRWERRSLQLKGKIEPVPVVVLTTEVRARVE